MNKHSYKLDVFYNNDSLSYYLLGAWMTDGCINIRKDRPNTKSCTLTSKDKDWLELINSLICPNKPLIKHGENCYRIMYNSTELCNWFINHGCIEKKSLILKMPEVPNQYVADFIRGCWDGDGSLSFTKSANKGKSWQAQANLTSGSLEFCKQLSEILSSLDIKNKIYTHGTPDRKIENRKITSNPCWRIVLSGGGSVYNLVKLLYSNDNLSMPRKFQIAQKIIVHRELTNV